MPSVPHLRPRRTALAGAVVALALLAGAAGAQGWTLKLDGPQGVLPPVTDPNGMGLIDAHAGTYPGLAADGWLIAPFLARQHVRRFDTVRVSDGATRSILTVRQLDDLHAAIWADGSGLHFRRDAVGGERDPKVIDAGETMTLDAVQGFAASLRYSPVDKLRVRRPVTFTVRASPPDGMPVNFHWNFAGQGSDDGTKVTFHSGFRKAGTYRVVMTATADDGTSAVVPVDVRVDARPHQPKPPRPPHRGNDTSETTTGGGAGGTGSSGAGGYGYGATAGTASAASAGTSATATTATTATATTTAAPTPTPVPVAAAGTGAAAPRPPLVVTTSDPVVRGEVLSGPLGSGAAPAPAPLPDRAVQAARQSRSETDSPFTLPNVVWELALILLLVGGGWWFERQNASSSRTVHHLR